MSESYIQLPPDSTGKRVRAIQKTIGSNTVQQEVDNVRDIELENPVYAVAVSASAVAASKHHLTLWNGSTSRLRILKIFVGMHLTAAVTGFIMQYLLYRLTSAPSGGTGLTIEKLDPADSNLPSGISATTGATVTISGAPLMIFTINPEEVGATCYHDFTPPKAIVVPNNTGVTIQQYATAGVGLFNAVIFFSVENIRP